MSEELSAKDRVPAPCAVGGERALTAGEVALASSVFGTAIDYSRVTLRRRKWAFFQPREINHGAARPPALSNPQQQPLLRRLSRKWVCSTQGLLIHELTHVWQTQTRGDWYLPLHRHPLCRYDYSLKPGWFLERYGIEQQAEIVKHAFWLRNGVKLAGATDVRAYDMLVDFPGAGCRQSR